MTRGDMKDTRVNEDPSEAMPAASAQTRERRRAGSALVSTLLSRYGLLLVLVFVIVLFSILMPNTYFTTTNFMSIAHERVVTLILALAVLTPLIVGEFDLSVAQLFGAVQLLVIGLMSMSGMSPVAAVVLSLLGGVLVGAVNALVIVKFQVNSFIATLGVSTVLQGLALWYSGGQVIFAHVPKSFLKMGQGELFGVSRPIYFGLVIAAVMWGLLKYTALGRKFFATGGSRAAATLSGVNNGRMVAVAFVLAGGLAAVAGVLIASQLGSGQPLLGPSYLLPAYAGAFLGATTVTPGRFNVWGTVIAVYLLAAGVTGLQQLGVPSWVEPVFNGLALVIAVAFSGFVARTRVRRRVRQVADVE